MVSGARCGGFGSSLVTYIKQNCPNPKLLAQKSSNTSMHLVTERSVVIFGTFGSVSFFWSWNLQPTGVSSGTLLQRKMELGVVLPAATPGSRFDIIPIILSASQQHDIAFLSILDALVKKLLSLQQQQGINRET
eukprot:15367183-Ditylum_brightwellii.AAC.2